MTREADIAAGWLTCTCCGTGLRDTPEENADYGKHSFDVGFGMCRGCGGDPKAKTLRKRMGWASCTFFDARIKILAEKLSEKSRTHFLGLSYQKKCRIIEGLITKGMMI